ncbi:uncharacterized protein LOC100252363, partial [Vitis vinifera]|uniref:uncharacterized protein LOC100252363 n=1 Tax=Vitis vinifera TaxID=29760 RepID=UPI0008FECC96
TKQDQVPQKSEKPPPWAVVRSLLTCKHLQTQQQKQREQTVQGSGKKCKKMKCSGSLRSNSKVMPRPEMSSPEDHKKRTSMASSNNDGSSRSMKAPLSELNGVVSSTSSSLSASSNSSFGGSFKGMPLRRLSGCYECRMVVDPVLGITRDPSLRTTICSCPDCGEIFMKAEILELHQAVRHAVSEPGPEDTSKNTVEIIFQSNWLKKQAPVILKVHNTPKTISKFEEYRDSNKTKATKLPKKHPRCVADGNERLRFHCTTFVCSIGLNGSSNLCNSIPSCNICSIIKNGFKVAGGVPGKRILTTATSGKARDSARMSSPDGKVKRAMLVCRVTSHVDFSRSNGLSAVGNYYQQEMGGATCIQVMDMDGVLPQPLLGMRWRDEFCTTSTSMHVLLQYRYLLDRLMPELYGSHIPMMSSLNSQITILLLLTCG